MEIGRRRIGDRIRALEKQVEKLSRQRDVRRGKRRREGIPILSIVGYTNVGKSTLLNALTESKIEAQNKLFMTLDPTSRRLRFPREGEVVITDTIGFIADLPPDLLAAFRATLEELTDADLLLHVVDATDPYIDDKVETVEKLLRDLDLPEIPVLRVLNKIDRVDPAEVDDLASRHQAVPISATQRIGLADLITAAERRLSGHRSFLAAAHENQRHSA
jgi:GTP-binding protein HflX